MGSETELRPKTIWQYTDGLHGMRRVVCYSGGHSSGISAIEVVRRYGVENVVLLNHDIIERSEDLDIKRFKVEVADYLGLPITYANMPGWETKDQFDVVIEAGAFKVGNGTALCTNRMKTQPFERWLKENIPSEPLNRNPPATIYYGFDSHEGNRINRRSTHLTFLGYRTDYPIGWKNRTIQSTIEIGIRPPMSYDVFRHANCKGCLKAGRQHWYCVYCLRPDVWTKGKFAEDEIGYTIIKGVSLEELEPLFERMKVVGIEPSERIPAATFWADVKRRLKVTVQNEFSGVPCECAH
jgi:hypothetical protein